MLTTRVRQRFVVSAFLLAALLHPLHAQQHPNFVMVVVDDLRFDEIAVGGHSYIETPNIDRLAAEGAMFTSAYHATPLCSPNRASILTGQYVSRHGILDNTSRSHASHRLDLFPKELQKSGYTTAHIGKWHMGNDPTPRPGYDYWVSFSGQGKTNDPDLYEDGRILAPTVLDVAGVEIPKHIQGSSITPLLSGKAEKIHDAILIEYYSHENPFPWTAKLDYRIVRKGKYKYIRWIRFEDEAELYDMDADPYELKNLVNDPSMATLVKTMQEDMRRLVLESLGLND